MDADSNRPIRSRGNDIRYRLIAPAFTLWWIAALVFVALSFAIVLLLSVVASATARLQIDTTVRFYWQCTIIFAVLAVASALFMRLKA